MFKEIAGVGSLKESGEKMKQDEVTLIYSGVVKKGNQSLVSVRFERKRTSGVDYAEGQVPECRIEKQRGFTADEIAQMEEYLREEKYNIIQKARELNNIKNLLS